MSTSSVSTALSVLVAVVSGTWFTAETIRVSPLADQNETLRSQLSAARSEIVTSEQALAELTTGYETLVEALDRPELLSPRTDSSSFGREVSFRWEYPNHTSFQRYVLEIRAPGESGIGVLRYNVPVPEKQGMHYEIPEGAWGEYLWRVHPGFVAGGELHQQSAPSGWSRFHVYRNAQDRIRETGVLRVATNPTYYGDFNVADGLGGHRGFDIELIHWVAEELSTRIGAVRPLEVRIVDYSWDRMFRAVEQNAADVAIATITKSVRRAERYPNLRFTTGYLTNQEVLIVTTPMKERDLETALRGKRVAVLQNSINLEVAEFLAPKLGFTVDAEIVDHGDIYRKLGAKEVDFGLIDRWALTGELNSRFHQFGPPLDPLLVDFYRERFGSDAEEFAIAVVHEPGVETKLVHEIDQILASAAGRAKLEALLTHLQSGKPWQSR